jgi:hypothetical protein
LFVSVSLERKRKILLGSISIKKLAEMEGPDQVKELFLSPF